MLILITTTKISHSIQDTVINNNAISEIPFRT